MTVGLASQAPDPLPAGCVGPTKYDTLTIHVAESTLAIEVDGETRVVRRTTTLAVRNIKVDRPYLPILRRGLSPGIRFG